MHDPTDEALKRADEIYQRLMRELRSDLERRLCRGRDERGEDAEPRAEGRDPSPDGAER